MGQVIGGIVVPYWILVECLRVNVTMMMNAVAVSYAVIRTVSLDSHLMLTAAMTPLWVS